jgi:hypothetical protein
MTDNEAVKICPTKMTAWRGSQFVILNAEMAHKDEPLFIDIKFKGYTEDAMPAQFGVATCNQTGRFKFSHNLFLS